MSDREQEHQTTMMSDQLQHLEALYEIMMSSNEPDMVRTALAALTRTTSGLAFLQAHPVTL